MFDNEFNPRFGDRGKNHDNMSNGLTTRLFLLQVSGWFEPQASTLILIKGQFNHATKAVGFAVQCNFTFELSHDPF